MYKILCGQMLPRTEICLKLKLIRFRHVGDVNIKTYLSFIST